MATSNGTANEVFKRILKERARQDRKWGTQNHSPIEWLSLIGEELGEAHEVVNKAFEGGKAGLNRLRLEGELLQVAALVVAALESFERTMGPQEWR